MSIIRLIKKQYSQLKEKLNLRANHAQLKKALQSGEPVIGRHPINVQIQTASACNGRCKFCPYTGSWQQKNPGKMSREIYEQIIQQLKPYTVNLFCPYLENEPLLDPDLFNKIEYAVKHLKPELVELASNCSALTQKHLAEIGRTMPKVKHRIRVSFHGVSKESYGEIMGLDYEKTLANIMQLIELSQNVPLTIEILGLGAPRKKDELKTWFNEQDYVEFWDKQLAGFTRKPKVVYYTYHDRASARQLQDKGMGFNTIVRDNLKGFYCNRFDRWAHFLYTGEPILCCMDYNRETAFGASIADQEIKDLFRSDRFLELIEKGCGMRESDKNFICKRCISPDG